MSIDSTQLEKIERKVIKLTEDLSSLANSGKINITQEELAEFKEIYLAKKQGEALERITKPFDPIEQIGLGYFDTPANMGINALILIDEHLNKIAGSTTNNLTKFGLLFAIGTGSRKLKRMENALNTIGQIGQFTPFNQNNLPSPEEINLNE